jgi:predicted transposase/invertase (TIGR01784 family)
MITEDMTGFQPGDMETPADGSGIEQTERFDHDGAWKDLIERFFYQLIERALPELYEDADREVKPRFLDKEFRDVLNTADPKIHTSPHFADYVLEVPLKNGGAEWIILHLEIQGRGGGNLAVRMYIYKSLIFAHYQREPAALAVITDRRPANEPLYYSHKHYGTESVYSYNNLVLSELGDDELTTSDNPIDLVLYAAKCALRSREELQKYNYLRKAVGLLGERGWSRDDKRNLLLFIERMLYLKDKKLEARYTEYRNQLTGEGKIVFIPMGEQELAKEIKQQGIEEGKREVARNLLANGVSPDIIAKSTGLPQEQLESLIN